jgi:hypothetical protein
MAISMRALLAKPDGGQVFSALVGLALLAAAWLFFAVSTVSRFLAGNENWWMGIAPLIGTLALILRLVRYLRLRHAR